LPNFCHLGKPTSASADAAGAPNRNPRRVVVGLVVLVGVSATLSGVAAGVPSAAPSPSRLVLKASQVGPEYRLRSRPDGQGVKGYVTLDLCGFTFPSEALRTQRLQVNYVRAGSPLGLSNEVVVYRPGGTQKVLRELRHAVSHCPTGPVGSHIAGFGPVTYRLKTLHPRRLLPGSIVLRVHVVGKASGRHIDLTVVTIYQTSGTVLSGIYTSGGPILAQERLGAHAAAESAKRLRGAT
jgi:hypothetical protein